MIDEIERVAIRSRAPMLLMGPTGVGKSFLARRVYELKKARHQVSRRFVELNCATLHGDGAASTLFGHIKGAFTDAASDRPGLLRSAHQGLLFLDEIGELGADEQAMLLRTYPSRECVVADAPDKRTQRSSSRIWQIRGSPCGLLAPCSRLPRIADAHVVINFLLPTEIGS